MTDVLFRAINYVEERGAVGLEEACAKGLKDAATELEKRIE